MSHAIQCVHCKAVLKSATPVPGGKKVKCPKCKQIFTTPAPKYEKTAEVEFEPPVDGSTTEPCLPAPIPPAHTNDDSEMAAASANLGGDQALGTETAPDAPALAPVPPPMSESDEMNAAIAKVGGDQALGENPAPAPAPVGTVASDEDGMVTSAPKPIPIPNMEIPDVDDDLVEPEDDEPAEEEPLDVGDDAIVDDEEEDEAPRSRETRRGDKSRAKTKHREEEDDEPRVKKKRFADDDDDEDSPRANKKRRADVDDDEEDEPRAKKKQRAVDDEDDEPPAKKRRRNDYEDEPHSKKKRQDDDDDEDDEPRSASRKKKKKSGVMLWIFLFGGGFLVLSACCGLGIGGYFLFALASPDIVGRWDTRDGGPAVFEFRSDGTGQTEVLGIVAFFDYRLNGSELRISQKRVRVGGNKDLPLPKEFLPIRVTRDGDTLRLQGVEGRPPVMILRKIG